MAKYTKAEKLLIDLGVSTPNDIDLEPIAWDQKVMVKIRPLEGCEARIVGINGAAIISVNESSRFTRQRFSIAHELGHWNIDRGTSFFCSSSDLEIGFKNSSLAERLANDFAADLLFPNYLFKPVINKIPELTWEIIKEVADDFQTSLPATAFRFIDSNEFPVILAVYDNLKRSWFKRSSQIPEKWFPKDYIAEPQSQKWSDSGTFPVSADSWFDHSDCADFEVGEQIFQYGDRILSLITINDDGMRDLE